MHRIVGAFACLFALSVAAAVPEDAPKPATPPDSDIFPVKRVEPRWPREALLSGISGRVTVEGTVGPDGSVVELRVIDSIPPGVFDRATLAAVKHWKFKPRVENGVAVARPFRQTIQFDLSYAVPSDPLTEFAKADRDKAFAYFTRMRGLCPDRYPHSDDAANAALQMRLTPENLRPALVAVEPERQAAADAALIREAEPCIFTSWEQLRDPEAYELAAWFASFGAGAAAATDERDAFRAFAAQKRTPPGTVQPSVPQTLQVRSWLFKRWVPAYYELINAQAKLLPPAPPTDKATTEALDVAKGADTVAKAKNAQWTLKKALKKAAAPVDRGLLLVTLARVQSALGEPEDALESLSQATAIEQLPWNLLMSAEMARATLCGRTGNAECFETSRTKLHAELGLTDKFKF